MNGWPTEDILKSGRAHGVPKNDVYGAVYHHVRDVVHRFCERLQKLDISFEMNQCNAWYLNEHMATDGRHFCSYRFDRIDLSNITDSMYLGSNIISSFAPFLKSPAENPHATILTLYMNTLKESRPAESNVTKQKRIDEVMRLMPLTPRDPLNHLHRAHYHNLANAVAFFIDSEALYRRFYDEVLMPTGKKYNIAVKEKNTIMERWPFALKGGKDVDSEKLELRAMLRSGVKGYALYVEWKLTGEVKLPDFSKRLADAKLQYYIG